MATLQEEILENVRSGTGPCDGCPARGECLHVGFFDDEADVLVVGHEPSLSHFDYETYGIEKSIDWYHEFYEGSGRIESWGFYDFLTDLFGPLGIDSSELPEWIYMTDLVKCPTKEFADRNWDTAFEHCESYFEQELTEIDPEVVLAVGNKSARHVLRVHGVPDGKARQTRVTNDYGLSSYDTSRPVVIVPHWGYFERNVMESEDRDELFRTVTDDLGQFVPTRAERSEKRQTETNDRRSSGTESQDDPNPSATNSSEVASGENVFLIPVDPANYDRTVQSPIDPSAYPDRPDALTTREEVRLWGVREGSGNRRVFEEIAPGDLLLFYQNGAYIGIGTIGSTFEDHDEWVSETFWEEAPSERIYTVENFRPIAVSRAAVNGVFDYGTEYYPQGPMRVADDRVPKRIDSIHLAITRFDRKHGGQ